MLIVQIKFYHEKCWLFTFNISTERDDKDLICANLKNSFDSYMLDSFGLSPIEEEEECIATNALQAGFF